jgi:hypothetical protein
VDDSPALGQRLAALRKRNPVPRIGPEPGGRRRAVVIEVRIGGRGRLATERLGRGGTFGTLTVATLALAEPRKPELVHEYLLLLSARQEGFGHGSM